MTKRDIAATRGKRLVVLVGTKNALGMAVRRVDTGQRYTALRQRLESIAIRDGIRFPAIEREESSS